MIQFMSSLNLNRFGICRIIGAVISGFVIAVSSPILLAQDSSGQQQQRETTKTPTMSEAVYKKLLEAQELIEAKNYDQGLAVLNEMASQPKLTSYEKAQIYNFFCLHLFHTDRKSVV